MKEVVIKKETVADDLGRVLPKEFIPTTLMNNALIGIVLLVIIIGMISFPFGGLMNRNTDSIFGVGWPWIFLNFGLADAGSLVYWGNLILDLLVWVVLSYVINVTWNVFYMRIWKRERNEIEKEEAGIVKVKKPKIVKPGIAEKLAEKVVGAKI